MGAHTFSGCQARLTEENLRLHRSSHTKKQRKSRPQGVITTPQKKPQASCPGRWDELADEETDTQETSIALRRAASLGALQIYGGCWASGFLALQDPLLWTPERTRGPDRIPSRNFEELDMQELAWEMRSMQSGSIETSRSSSQSGSGSPRSDSDTLSYLDADEERTKKWSWKSLGRRRRESKNSSRAREE